MSGELQITGGGAIAVDPEQLRAVSGRLAAVAAMVSDAAESVLRAHEALLTSWHIAPHVDPVRLWMTSKTLTDGGDALASDAASTSSMADLFELADLRAQQTLLSVMHPDRADRLQERIDELIASDPGIETKAEVLSSEWGSRSQQGLLAQPIDEFVVRSYAMMALLPASMWAAQLRHLTKIAGAPPHGATLKGDPPPVTVTQVSTSKVSGGSAVSLTQLVERLPGGKAQVAVEKRTHADGSESFVAYVDGTRDLWFGGDEPWDMESNWELYAEREQSDAYAATVEALEMAGAEPGAAVDIVGYSQGGAIAGAIATSGVYETQRVMIVGSPTVPSLEADQTLIRVFHTDDPIGAGLTAGGPVGTTGSSDSLTVFREYATGSELTSLDAHPRDAYDQTIEQADESGDARVTAVHQSLGAEAADIVAVERMEFHATRK